MNVADVRDGSRRERVRELRDGITRPGGFHEDKPEFVPTVEDELDDLDGIDLRHVKGL